MKTDNRIQHKVGDKVIVTISSTTPYGAFADLADGGSGLIHISEIADCYIRDVSSYLKPNSVHEVLIIGLGEKPFTYSLSLRRLLKRPRQRPVTRVKPLTRKESNKRELDSVPFTSMEKALPDFIEKEYKRLNEKN